MTQCGPFEVRQWLRTPDQEGGRESVFPIALFQGVVSTGGRGWGCGPVHQGCQHLGRMLLGVSLPLLKGDCEMQVDMAGWIRGSPSSSLLEVVLRKRLQLPTVLSAPEGILPITVPILSAHPPQERLTDQCLMFLGPFLVVDDIITCPKQELASVLLPFLPASHQRTAFVEVMRRTELEGA